MEEEYINKFIEDWAKAFGIPKELHEADFQKSASGALLEQECEPISFTFTFTYDWKEK